MRGLTRSMLAGAAATAALLLAPLPSGAATTKSLEAVVGPGFTISVTAGKKTASQAASKSKLVIQPGRYTISVSDRSSIHDFHLIGPNVDKKTGVAFKGDVTWHLTLRTGTYRFVCDPHKTIMKGLFTVSNI